MIIIAIFLQSNILRILGQVVGLGIPLIASEGIQRAVVLGDDRT